MFKNCLYKFMIIISSPFWFLKDFLGTLYFQIVGDICIFMIPSYILFYFLRNFAQSFFLVDCIYFHFLWSFAGKKSLQFFSCGEYFYIDIAFRFFSEFKVPDWPLFSLGILKYFSIIFFFYPLLWQINF